MSLSARSAGAPTGEYLLVLLHGWGANAQDVAAVADYLELPNYQMYFPEAPYPHQVSAGMAAPEGRMWYALTLPVDFNSSVSHQPDLQSSRQYLLNWLHTLPQQTGVPLEKTVLGGFSQGGAMTLDVGMELPLAGMLVLSGYSHSPIAAPVSPRPILLVHGCQDPVVPISQAQQTKATLDGLVSSLNYCELNNMGHEISLEVLTLVQQFCEQLCTDPA